MREDVEETDLSLLSTMQIEDVRPQAPVTKDFKNSMRNLAASVCVVTARIGGQAHGFTATSVVSLSVDTPTLLVSVNRSSSSWPAVRSSGKFAVNILSTAHFDIAETFAGRRGLQGHDRYIDTRWQQEGERVPHLTDALAVIDCEVEETIERYTHAILIGRVTGVVSGASDRPLVYWQGGYSHLCDRPNNS
jgi:flavin reductase (DIM6/NTAB) family NADH-FMN oxidoreductase RutF